MLWPERRAGVELSQKCFVRITSMLAVQSGMQRNERGVQRYSSFITVTRLRIDASSHGETANGAAASAKSELPTYAYYVRTLKYYAPAIYHGQGLARYGRTACLLYTSDAADE